MNLPAAMKVLRGNEEYIVYAPDFKTVHLDGHFTIKELEALVVRMKAGPQWWAESSARKEDTP